MRSRTPARSAASTIAGSSGARVVSDHFLNAPLDRAAVLFGEERRPGAECARAPHQRAPSDHEPRQAGHHRGARLRLDRRAQRIENQSELVGGDERKRAAEHEHEHEDAGAAHGEAPRSGVQKLPEQIGDRTNAKHQAAPALGRAGERRAGSMTSYADAAHRSLHRQPRAALPKSRRDEALPRTTIMRSSRALHSIADEEQPCRTQPRESDVARFSPGPR